MDNRLMGAIAIAGAGALFGFASGRFSAWLVPAGSPVAAQYGSESKPSIPLEPAAPKQAAAPIEPPKASPAPQPPPADAGMQKAETRAPGVTTRGLSPSEQTATTEPTATPEMKLLNPGGTQQRQRSKVRQPSTALADTEEGTTPPPTLIGQGDEGLERCRAKYRSFDPVDGTYKPYGQDTRVRCPHLR